MRMGRGNHIGTRGVHLRMDGKCRAIDRIFSLHHFAVVIHQNQVGRSYLAEVHPEGVYPEMVEPLGIARGDVSCHSFIESELRKKPERGSKHLLAMEALLRGVGKHRRSRHVQYICGCSGHLALPCAENVLPWHSTRDYIQCPPR